jgi:hypothetical protein
MRRYRYSWFLSGLIATIVVAPIAERGAIADIAHQTLFTIVVLLALNTTAEPGGRQIVAIVCTVGWLILSWSDFLFGSLRFHITAGIVFFCLLFVVLYDILKLLLRVRRTDSDILSAAIAAYLLLGVAWAVSFDVFERIMPGSFHGLDPQQKWAELLYFSMGTLTTVGYGDIIPTNPLVGIWATLEAVCGVLYVAVLISHLVAQVRD